MPEVELRGPLMVIRPDKLPSRVGHETLVICGAPRGKTSVSAFVFHHLGYHLGDDLGEQNYEDQAFLSLVPPTRASGQLSASSALKDLIERRNAQHSRWGFKLPHATGRLAELEPMLRNPVIFLCVRNPLGVARTIMKRDGSYQGRSLLEYFDVGMRPFLLLNDLIEKLSAPVILADMDEATLIPTAFVQQTATMFNLEGEIDEIASSISVAGYKTRVLSPGEVTALRAAKSEAFATNVQRQKLK